MNVPKLTKADLPIFNGIMNDLFPGVETASIVNVELRETIINELTSSKLQPVEVIVTKISQLYETKLMRHGTMGNYYLIYLVIGPSGIFVL